MDDMSDHERGELLCKDGIIAVGCPLDLILCNAMQSASGGIEYVPVIRDNLPHVSNKSPLIAKEKK
jgi:hypothetical protein